MYATLKLMHKLGTANAAGHSLVMQLKDTWKGIGARYAGMKRTATAGVGTSPVAAAAAAAVVVAATTGIVATTTNNQHSNNSSGSATVDKSNAASLTSFIMN